MPQERKILQHLSDFSVRYYGRPLDQDQARWQQEWVDQPHLLDRIEVSITFEDGDDRTSRTLTVQPKVH